MNNGDEIRNIDHENKPVLPAVPPMKDGPGMQKRVEEHRLHTGFSEEEAVRLLLKYNSEPFHLQHAYTVSAVMAWYAGFLEAGNEDFWAMAGLLHDVDFEKWPEEHCRKAPELLSEIGASEELVHAVVCHGYGLCSDVEPESLMEKVLFAADELTGLIGAAALMRPSGSCTDMELKSLKKKFKDKRFAAGCDREVIAKGAEILGWELDQLLERTLRAMAETEADIRLRLEK